VADAAGFGARGIPDTPQETGTRKSDELSRGAGGIRGGGWWTVEPAVGRVAHGVADRVDRLRAIGNGQVPLVAAQAWQILIASTYPTKG
jgi:DNA (cytosine-5)-methyltransferase 1